MSDNPTDCGNETDSVTSTNGAFSTLSTLSTPSQGSVDLLANLRDGAWLDQQVFPPLRFAIPGLIPEGATILIGPPKVGKSYLLGDLLLAKAAGGHALGKIPVGGQAPVLYLALEDGHRRMQARCRELLGDGEPIPQPFNYLTAIQPGQVLVTIEAFLARWPSTALVVLDTLGKVVPPAAPGESAYARDYRIAGALKRIADSHPGLSLVVVHHDRKAGTEDFVESVSGTNGLAGAMDTIMLLVRQRGSTDGLLKVTGRDVPEAEYALTVSDGQWTLDGANLGAACGAARQREESAGLGDRSTQIIRLVNNFREGIGPTKLAELMDIAPKHAGEYLRRLADTGRITKIGRGRYRSAHATVESVESVESAGGDLIPFPQDRSVVETDVDSPEDA